MNSSKLNTLQANQIRRRLNAAYSSIFVYGTGVDSGVVEPYAKNPMYAKLISSSTDKISEWKSFVDKSNSAKQIDFFKTLVELKKLAPQVGFVNNATHYILKTSVLDTLGFLEGEDGFNLLELNGNASEAFSPLTGSVVKLSGSEDVNSKLDDTFPRGSYDSKKRLVATFEEAYTRDLIHIALFVGASGYCPVTESLYNRALVNKSFIVVVNADPDCFMHSLADISIVGDASEFLDDLNLFYNGGSLDG
ncbi:conserved hypothetical protein [Vibrio chagasii]|nr:conserved hypothetical protein [Vibrio chagasii]